MERAKEQQGLQLILSKLIPSLWPIQHEQNQPSSTTNQYQEQSYQQLWQQPAPISQLGGVDATPQSSPTRQLVSAHSNQLFYPPGEQAEAPNRPQVAEQYRPPLSANHHSNYPAQHQQHYQSVSAWQPSGSAQSMVGYRPAPPASPGYQPAEWAPASHWPQTVPTNAGSSAQQMSGTGGGGGGTLSALLSFLANNKANLSNLIQLVPLIAQTLSILPRVLQGSAPQSASGSRAPGAASTGPLEGSASLGELASQSVLSLLQSGNSSSHSDRLSERLQAGSPSADSNESADNNQAKRPSGPNELSLSQPSVTGSLFGEFLPQITRHLLASLLQAARQQPAELGGRQRLPAVGPPLVSYLLEPAAPAGPPTRPAASGQSWAALGWLRGLIGSLASSAGRAGFPAA